MDRRVLTQAAALSDAVKRRGQSLGFDAIGIAPLQTNPHAAALDRWLAAGHAGQMRYMERQAKKRKDPRLIMPEATCAVVTLTNYYHSPPPRERGRGRGWVAQYAWSTDYHRVLTPRLERLAAAIRELAPGARTRVYLDAGPVPERDLAQSAGLGWIGKNTMLIHPRIGSFTFIGVILTDATLASDLPFTADHCGTCRACLDACPTAAFVAPGDLDARRCISYLTIEHRQTFTERQAASVGEWVFGCDVCQDVCPWNIRFAAPTDDSEFAPRAELRAPNLVELCGLDDAGFDARFGDTAFDRPGRSGLRRNATAVRANKGEA
jgi:epoxyqueuosine reductase